MTKIIVDRKQIMELCGGSELIDVEHRKDEHSCVETSDEVVLHFANGQEISIYFLSDEESGTVVVEAD